MPKSHQPEEKLNPRAKSKLKGSHRLLVVEVKYILRPGADARLWRAIDILLRSAARNEAQGEESDAQNQKPPYQAPKRHGEVSPKPGVINSEHKDQPSQKSD